MKTYNISLQAGRISSTKFMKTEHVKTRVQLYVSWATLNQVANNFSYITGLDHDVNLPSRPIKFSRLIHGIIDALFVKCCFTTRLTRNPY